MQKKLYRSNTNRVIAGVCGGIGEYFGLDPTLVRIITILLVLLPGINIIAYIIAWIIIPLRPLEMELTEEETTLTPLNRYLPGVVLIFFGLLLLFREFIFYFHWGDIWPLLLIGAGVALILYHTAGERRRDQARSELFGNGENGGQGS
jgi:phage shock protein C